MSLVMMKATIEAMTPDTMSDDEVASLVTMLDLDSFSSLVETIDKKLESYYEYLWQHPEKQLPSDRKETSQEPKDDGEGPTISFKVNKSGILVPLDIKK